MAKSDRSSAQSSRLYGGGGLQVSGYDTDLGLMREWGEELGVDMVLPCGISLPQLDAG